MRAVTQASFGGPEQLKIDSIDKPIPAAGQVLVRVIATSVNRPDIIQRQVTTHRLQVILRSWALRLPEKSLRWAPGFCDGRLAIG